MKRFASDPPMTGSMERVLETLLADPAQARTAREIACETGLAPAATVPILASMEAVGWVRSRWETADPRVTGRLPRRRYSFAPEGARLSRMAILRAHRPAAARRWLVPAGCVA